MDCGELLEQDQGTQPPHLRGSTTGISGASHNRFPSHSLSSSQQPQMQPSYAGEHIKSEPVYIDNGTFQQYTRHDQQQPHQSHQTAFAAAVNVFASSTVLDFAPSVIHLPGPSEPSPPVKMLICLAFSEALANCRALPLQVCLADAVQLQSQGHLLFPGSIVRMTAEVVSPSVLRCWVSPHLHNGTSSYRLWVTDAAGNQVTPISEQILELRRAAAPAVLTQPPPSTAQEPMPQLGKRTHQAQRPLVPVLSMPGGAGLSAATVDRPFQQRHEMVAAGGHSDDRAADRVNKIRIVEKLGYVTSALRHDDHGALDHRGASGAHNQCSSSQQQLDDPDSPDGNSGSGSGGDPAEQWLDDQQLSSLSHDELEALMDRYIMAVVQQMVQLAALDDDLQAEIDSLDSSGFSLLHYCSLYNLTSLIPVLLDKGADINKRTAVGTSSLHLAASAGHFQIVQLLCDCNADISLVDKSDQRASHVALQAGRSDIYEYLYEVNCAVLTLHYQ